jgi:hypothetical protein
MVHCLDPIRAYEGSVRRRSDPDGAEEEYRSRLLLVNGAPEILLLTLDIHEKFIRMPNVAQATLSSLEFSGIFGTELQTLPLRGPLGDRELNTATAYLD